MLRFTGGLCSSRSDPTRQLRLSKMVLGPQWNLMLPRLLSSSSHPVGSAELFPNAKSPEVWTAVRGGTD